MFNLFEKLRSDKWCELFNDLSPKALYIRRVLIEKYFIIDLEIGQADEVHKYFFKKPLDLNNLYTIFDESTEIE